MADRGLDLMANNEVYNSYLNVRQLPKRIVDHLYKNADEFWKLLYYSQSTINQPNVSNTIKKNMIATSSSGDNSDKQILFEVYTSDATISANAQVRISVLEVKPTNRTNGKITLLIQCIVNDKASVISTDISPVESKAFAIAQELIKELNGTEFEGLNGCLWLDKGQDGRTGLYKTAYGNGFSGYDLIMGAQV